jgi:hypothetical protein
MRVSREESKYKGQLMETFREQLPRFVAIRHENTAHSGTPDISIDGMGKCSWLEVKHGTPNFDSDGRQELLCLRLAGANFCRYVIYHEDAQGNNKRTLIVHPKNLRDLIPETFCVGFNHQFVVDYIKKRHGA